MQRRWFGEHVGAVHVPVAATQSAAVAHAVPIEFQPVCPALQTSGCAPLQRVSPDMHAAGLHEPLAASHSAAVAQALPCGFQPFWPALQTCGCAPMQRV